VWISPAAEFTLNADSSERLVTEDLGPDQIGEHRWSSFGRRFAMRSATPNLVHGLTSCEQSWTSIVSLRVYRSR